MIKKRLCLSLIVLLGTFYSSFGQLAVPYVNGGPLVAGSLLSFESGGSETSVQENWGLNICGNNVRPVKIFNSSLLVGYPSVGDDFGSNNVMVNGNVGIGTKSPAAKLDMFSSHNVNNKVLKMFYQGSWGTVDYANNFRFIDISSTEGNNVLQVNGYGIGMGFNPPSIYSGDKLYVNGNVGIGTADPKGYKLAVNGSAVATSVTVKENGNWPDYVFDNGYQLLPLTEIEVFIKRNKHLPEVPSAADIAKNGLNLGEMNSVLMKKVEELTLILIEKDKQLQKQEEKMRDIDLRVSKLTDRLDKFGQ